MKNNNEQVQEINEIVQEPQDFQPRIDAFNEFKLDNEVNRIINQGGSVKRNLGSNKKHLSSAIQQESTDIATDENTARISHKAQYDSPENQKLTKNTSREVIMNTHTIPESSMQNDDLNIVTEQQPTEQEEKEIDFLDYVKYLLDNQEAEPEEIITEIEKNTLLENKTFEDELDDLKHEIKQYDQDIRDLK